jgi:hypothetical protein
MVKNVVANILQFQTRRNFVSQWSVNYHTHTHIHIVSCSHIVISAKHAGKNDLKRVASAFNFLLKLRG